LLRNNALDAKEINIEYLVNPTLSPAVAAYAVRIIFAPLYPVNTLCTVVLVAAVTASNSRGYFLAQLAARFHFN